MRAAIDRMLAAADAGDQAIDRRDAALLAVAYDTLLRRSELVALRLEDFARAGDGSATVLVRRSKTDAAGLAPLVPSAHSTRVGACQDMLAAGLKLPEVMQAGSWKSAGMVTRYGERLLARRGAARKLATLQNRT